MLFSKLKKHKAFRKGQPRRIAFEPLEARRLLASLPYGAHPDDTGEFMLGSVVVTPVFLESNGTVDANSENWNAAHIQDTLARIQEGMDWWVESLDRLNTVHDLTFVIDTTFASTPVSTVYEPINRRSNDYVFYVNEFLQNRGFSSGNIETEIRKFNHSQREKFDADWSFTIFVANSELQNSQDQMGGQFASGGSFRRAFAFAGGLFMVVPSTRPDSTFAHETGHMFWARDEYSGGGTFFSRRGYYNSQNENAWNNPTQGFVQQPSIMASGTLLDTAYQNFTSAPATFAQLGWKDSDSNGIFDVLDVPSLLIGSGYWDAEAGLYRFTGTAEVQRLRNQNSSGLQNDITLNRIREIEYRFNGGAWQVISQPNTYSAELDLAIPVPPGASAIEIRARDSQSTITSNIFTGRLARADSTLVNGINGFIWIDHNKNGLRDVGELGQAGWTVSLVNGAGEAVQLRNSVEPDSLPVGPVGSSPIGGVVFVSIGGDSDGRVGVSNDASASTGSRVFSAFSVSSQTFLNTWTASNRRLQASFVTPTSTVSLDAIGTASGSYGRLEAYNSSGQMIGRYTTGPLQTGEVQTMTISRGTDDIAYIIAAGASRTDIRLDNLQFGPISSVLTGPLGQFNFPSLPAMQYQVKVTAPSGFVSILPSSGQSTATVVANTPTQDVDFGFRDSANPWHKSSNRFDVNNDNRVSAIDALQVINVLNSFGSGVLQGSGLSAPPFVDVNDDGRVSAFDALQVINFLNSRSSGTGGEGEQSSAADGGTSGLDNSGGTFNSGGRSNDSGSNTGGQSGGNGEGEALVSSVSLSVETTLNTGAQIMPSLISQSFTTHPSNSTNGASLFRNLQQPPLSALQDFRAFQHKESENATVGFSQLKPPTWSPFSSNEFDDVSQTECDLTMGLDDELIQFLAANAAGGWIV